MVALVGQIKLDGVVARLVDLEVLSIKFRQVVEVVSVVVGTTPRDGPVVVGAEFQFACNQIARPLPSLHYFVVSHVHVRVPTIGCCTSDDADHDRTVAVGTVGETCLDTIESSCYGRDVLLTLLNQ